MPSSIVSPFPFFTDASGAPLEAGYIYIGQSNLNPETAPVNVFWDLALTIPAGQPIRTVGGYPSRAGSPSRFYVSNDTYSITVRNRNHALVFSAFDQSDAPTSVFDVSTQLITATAGQLTFTLTTFTYLPGTDTLEIYRNGLRLNLGLDYLETNSSTVTLTTAAAAGDQFLFQGGSVVSGNQVPGSQVSFIQAGTGAVTRNIQDKARESVSVKDFGAVGDGVTDDTAAIQAAIDSISANGGTVTLSGPHLLSGSITVGPNVVLDGQTKPGEVLPQGTWGPPTAGRFEYKKAGTLLLPTTATINLKNRSSLKGLSVVTSATSTPATTNAAALAVIAAFSGTAITVQGPDTSVEDCLVIGYNKAYYCDGYERPTVQGNIFDCTNGVEITACTDKPVVSNNHFYPIYSTGHNTNLNDNQLVRRQGKAIYVHDVADGALIYNNITYGFDLGCHLKNLTLIRYCENIHDNLYANSATSNSIGLKIEGTMSACAFDNIHCNSNTTNYVFSNNGTNEYFQAGTLSSSSAKTRDLFITSGATGQISGLLIGGIGGGAPTNIEFSSGVGIWNIGFIQFSECQTSTNAITYTQSDLSKIFIGSIQVVGGGASAANPTIGGRLRSHKNYILSGDADSAAAYFPGSFEGNGQWIIEGKTSWTKRVALGVDTISGGTMTAYLQAVEAGVAAREMQINPRGGTVQISTGGWNTGPARLGSFYLWVDSSGRLRIKNGAPASDTDGTVVGTQS